MKSDWIHFAQALEDDMTTENVTRPAFNPMPLDDDWTRWIVGEWVGSGESNAGQGRGTVRVESGLSGQFLIYRGDAEITQISPEHADYLRRNMNASDEEIERFKGTGYHSLEIYTLDQQTGDVIGYLFDNLRCLAKGRGKREGYKETVNWEWSSGYKGTRITQRLSDDRMQIVERTPMPDGSVMEDKGEMIRRK
jgi:hypothetical protein